MGECSWVKNDLDGESWVSVLLLYFCRAALREHWSFVASCVALRRWFVQLLMLLQFLRALTPPGSGGPADVTPPGRQDEEYCTLSQIFLPSIHIVLINTS